MEVEQNNGKLDFGHRRKDIDTLPRSPPSETDGSIGKSWSWEVPRVNTIQSLRSLDWRKGL